MSAPAMTAPGKQSLAARLWAYQAERFPLAKTATLLAVFSAASINVSALLAGRPLPGIAAYATAFLLVLVIFFQMRACDEVKDEETDRLHRPDRAIPRGLVTLQEVTRLAAALVPLALLVALWHDARLVLPLLLVWIWLALMTAEFFVPAWLAARPFLYLASHMLIMPLIDLLVTAVEWIGHGWRPPHGLALFLLLSFLNGCVLEIGRKTWAAESERPGVETYSSLLGPKRAAMLWLAMVGAAFLVLIAVGVAVGRPYLVAATGLAGLLATLWAGLPFLRSPDLSGQKRIDTLAGVWVLVCYSAAGFLPLFARGVLS